MVAIDSDPLLTKSEKAQQKQSLYIAYNLNGTLGSHSLATTVSPLSNSFYSNDTVESVVGKLYKFPIKTLRRTKTIDEWPIKSCTLDPITLN